MDPQERAFLDHLEKNPDDHETRLVFADYLDERDRPEEAAWQRSFSPLRYLKARQLLVNFAQRNSLTYDVLVEAGRKCQSDGTMFRTDSFSMGADNDMAVDAVREAFWDAWAYVTETPTEVDNSAEPFSCNCTSGWSTEAGREHSEWEDYF